MSHTYIAATTCISRSKGKTTTNLNLDLACSVHVPRDVLYLWLYVLLSQARTRRISCPHSPPITDILSVPTILPASDTLFAIGSPEDVTYNCRANEDDIFWELNGRQIQGEITKAMYRNAHIFIETELH